MTAHILVVDDSEELRELLAAFLRAEGYSVVTASNGAEALAELRGGPPPSVVLMDLEMPVMSGWEVLAIVGQDPALASLPIVVVSGANVDIAKIPAAGHFKKPVELPRLRELLGQLVAPADASPRFSAPALGQVVSGGALLASPDAEESLAAAAADPPPVADPRPTGTTEPELGEQEPAACDPSPAGGEKIGDP